MGRLLTLFRGVGAAILRDFFTVDDAAPVTSPRDATPGPGTMTALDTENKILIADGKLKITGGKSTPGSSGDPGVVWDNASRATGLVLRSTATYLAPALGGTVATPLGWSTGPTGNTPRLCNANFSPAGEGLRVDSADQNLDTILRDNWKHDLAFRVKSSGFQFLTKYNGQAAYRFRWNARNDTTATIRPASYTFDKAYDLENVRVDQLRGAWESDTGLSTAFVASPTSPETVAHRPDAWIEFRWTPASAETLTIEFRRVDADNLWRIECAQAAGTIKLYERVAGVDTERDAGKTQTFTIGTAYRIVIIADSLKIWTWVNNGTKHRYNAAYSSLDGESAVVSGFTTGANLETIPLYVNLSTGGEYVFPTEPVAANAASPLTVPIYAGNDVTHPDVWDFGAGETWSGYRYWMVTTPLQSAAVENPSISASNDGTTWVVPDGLTNPIDDPGGVGYNSDGCLVYDHDEGVMWCVWRYVDAGEVTHLYAMSSTDGSTWGGKIELDLTATGAMSPSVLYEDGAFVMYYVRSGGSSGNWIQRITSATMAGTWSAAADVYAVSRGNPTQTWWHVTVKKRDGRYWLVSNINVSPYPLWAAWSDDGIAWHPFRTPLMLPSASGWDRGQLYRVGLAATDEGFDMWYAGYNSTNGWRIGRSSFAV